MAERENKIQDDFELPSDLNRIREMIEERRNEYKIHELAQRDAVQNMREIDSEIVLLLDHAQSSLGVKNRKQERRDEERLKLSKKNGNKKTP